MTCALTILQVALDADHLDDGVWILSYQVVEHVFVRLEKAWIPKFFAHLKKGGSGIILSGYTRKKDLLL